MLAFINIGICTSLSAQNEEEDDDDQETSSNFISTQGAYSNLLIQAINENDAAKVAEAIKNVPVVGGYIPTRNANHISYFLYAVANSTPEVIKTMLANDAYAKSGINTYRGNTPLMIALLNARQPGVADFLYQNGFNNVDEVCPNGYTALHKAIVNRNIMAIQWLLDHKANINSVDFLGHTPLMYAIINHSPTMVNFLLKYKPDINTIDFLGTNALGYTNSLQEKRAKQENISHDDNVLKEYDSIRVLLEKNKAVNITLTTDRRNLKPQQIAFAYILFGDTAGIKTLLQNGLDVESRNSKGQTLLQQAVMNKDAAMIKLLKRYNANANTTDYMGNDMLMQACESFDEELIPYIVLAGHIKVAGH